MDEDTAMVISLAAGGLLGLWAVAWMFHVGPDGNQQSVVWWAIPYWITSLAAGVAVFVFVGFIGSCIYYRFRKRPLGKSDAQS